MNQLPGELIVKIMNYAEADDALCLALTNEGILKRVNDNAGLIDDGNDYFDSIEYHWKGQEKKRKLRRYLTKFDRDLLGKRLASIRHGLTIVLSDYYHLDDPVLSAEGGEFFLDFPDHHFLVTKPTYLFLDYIDHCDGSLVCWFEELSERYSDMAVLETTEDEFECMDSDIREEEVKLTIAKEMGDFVKSTFKKIDYDICMSPGVGAFSMRSYVERLNQRLVSMQRQAFNATFWKNKNFLPL